MLKCENCGESDYAGVYLHPGPKFGRYCDDCAVKLGFCLHCGDPCDKGKGMCPACYAEEMAEQAEIEKAWDAKVAADEQAVDDQIEREEWNREVQQYVDEHGDVPPDHPLRLTPVPALIDYESIAHRAVDELERILNNLDAGIENTEQLGCDDLSPRRLKALLAEDRRVLDDLKVQLGLLPF